MKRILIAALLLTLCACSDEPVPVANEPDTSAQNTTTTPTTTSANNAAPNVGQGAVNLPPRWVLRDKDGSAVYADVTGYKYIPDVAEGGFDFGEWGSDCFRVNIYDGRPWPSVGYNALTGKPSDSCVGVFDNLYYSLPSCEGAPHFTQRLAPVSINGEVKAAYGAVDASLSSGDVYSVKVNGACSDLTATTDVSLWKLKALPAWAVDAFPDAPYSIAVE